MAWKQNKPRFIISGKHNKAAGANRAQSLIIIPSWEREWMANFYIARNDINSPPGLLSTYSEVYVVSPNFLEVRNTTGIE